MDRRDQTIGQKAEYLEDTIDNLEQTYRDNHIARLNTGECGVQQGLIFIDMLHNFEKIGDHTFNLTKAIVGGAR
jgi:phosphate:Na+ symporter